MLTFLGRIACLFGRHERSKGRVRDDGPTKISVCKKCGKPMRQLPRRKWVADRKARELRAARTRSP